MRVVPAALLVLGLAAAGCGDREDADAPGRAVAELLAADRAFSAAAADTDLADALEPMFAADVVMPLPDGTFAEGAAAALASVRGNPANAGARAEWHPIRGGISADGQHGFTFGYFTLRAPGGAVTPGKYMSYWVRDADGWRVAAWKRSRADGAAAEVPPDTMPPALPRSLVRAAPDRVAAFSASLDSAERAFSDDAQRLGLGPAFRNWGSPDAVNMGRGPRFTVGADSIAAGFPDYGAGSPVSWAPERVIVASSGDLGVTIGFIRDNAVADRAVPFFTIWRRPTPLDPWRYVAE